MSTIAQITQNDTAATSVTFADVQDIRVEYDDINDGVTVTPSQMAKGTTVRFQDPKGGKLRIVFLSPSGKEIEPVFDSQSYLLTVGGTYHFKCFFLPLGATTEISPKNGGILDVVPQRP